MALHFSPEELDGRRRRAIAAMAERGLDGLLLFRPESHYYLTGFDTFGYVFFQCLVFTADGGLTLLTRAPDLRQAQRTSVIQDIRIWTDHGAADPVLELVAILGEKGLASGRIGVEWDGHGLTAKAAFRLAAALAGVGATEDASDLVDRLRVIKSDAERAYIREAARLADDAFDAALAVAAPGVSDAHVLAAMQGAVFRGDGDYPGNPFIVGSGDDALLCRYAAGRRLLAESDQLTLEWAGVFRHYHACLMATVLFGDRPPAQRAMFSVAKDALAATIACLVPGRVLSDAFAAHARTFDGAGFQAHRLNACGYSVGATFAPSWMDWPMLHAGNDEVIAEGMCFFVHMILFDSDRGLAMTLGRTVDVTADGPHILSRLPLELVSL